MYNISFVGNTMLEIKVIGLCEERGFSWRKSGEKVSVMGVDNEVRDIIEKHSDRFWGW